MESLGAGTPKTIVEKWGSTGKDLWAAKPEQCRLRGTFGYRYVEERRKRAGGGGRDLWGQVCRTRKKKGVGERGAGGGGSGESELWAGKPEPGSTTRNPWRQVRQEKKRIVVIRKPPAGCEADKTVDNAGPLESCTLKNKEKRGEAKRKRPVGGKARTRVD